MEEIGGTGDEFTGDHQPAKGFLDVAARITPAGGFQGDNKLFGENTRLNVEWRAGGHAHGATTINMHEARHRKTRTYKGKIWAPRAVWRAALVTAVQNATGVAAKRDAVIAALEQAARDDATHALGAAVYGAPLSDKELWGDLYGLGLKNDVEREQLRERIRAQVRDGESHMSMQSLAHLKD